jgi:hypothetical protein
VETRPSSRWRCGHNSATMTEPITASLISPLAKLASAWLENSRFNPASGEIFENFGFSESADQTSRCWIMLPASAASTRTASGNAIAASASRRRLGRGNVADLGALEPDRCHRRRRPVELQWRQIARPVVWRIGIGDVFRQETLALLMPLHPGAQHREQRQVGDGHAQGLLDSGGILALPRWRSGRGPVPDQLGKLCRVYG